MSAPRASQRPAVAAPPALDHFLVATTVTTTAAVAAADWGSVSRASSLPQQQEQGLRLLLHAATLAHEMVHWTKHPTRLNRDLGRKKWGDEGYAMEELVAEIGSAFLCADLQITPEVRNDHADYIGSWLKVLKEDNRAVFQAASLASKAVEHLHQLQPSVQT